MAFISFKAFAAAVKKKIKILFLWNVVLRIITEHNNNKINGG